MISIESGLDKVQDFAMEFYSDGQGTVRYEGLSVFNTEERGSYTGNILEEQSTMLSRITRFTGEETYSRIQEAVRTVLQEVYGSTYAGCIGVDMLVYRQKDGSFAIHPCIEINMRYTMGMVALRLFQHYVVPRLLAITGFLTRRKPEKLSRNTASCLRLIHFALRMEGFKKATSHYAPSRKTHIIEPIYCSCNRLFITFVKIFRPQ